MNRSEIRHLLKRYRYISEAIREEKSAAFFSIGERRERISIDEDVKKFSKAVMIALDKSKNAHERRVLEQYAMEGRHDVNVYSQSIISRGSYYRLKENFFNRVFCLCILMGIVSIEEI